MEEERSGWARAGEESWEMRDIELVFAESVGRGLDLGWKEREQGKEEGG